MYGIFADMVKSLVKIEKAFKGIHYIVLLMSSEIKIIKHLNTGDIDAFNGS